MVDSLICNYIRVIMEQGIRFCRKRKNNLVPRNGTPKNRTGEPNWEDIKHTARNLKQKALNWRWKSDELISKLAKNLGIHYKTLYAWVKKAMPETASTQAGKSKIKSLESEVKRLRKALKHTEQERDILKKAATYFASENL